jgi:hypothetical protein
MDATSGFALIDCHLPECKRNSDQISNFESANVPVDLETEFMAIY